MSLIWQDIQTLAANWRAGVFRLSGDVGAFLLSGTSEYQMRRLWIQDTGEPVDDSQWDQIEALTAKAYTEIMSPVLLGTIFPFITLSPPDGSLECDGTTYLRTDYPALFVLLDPVFLIDGDHFITPDLRGRTVIGAGAGTGLSTYAVNDTGGEESHTLITAEMPAHSHSIIDLGHTHTEGAASPTIGAAITGVPVPSAIPIPGITGLSPTGISVQNSGGDGSHENRQPYCALRYAIWAT